MPVFSLAETSTDGIVPPKDSTAIAGAVAKLFGDSKKAASFGDKGRELAESVYSEDLFVEKTLEVYKKALKSR